MSNPPLPPEHNRRVVPRKALRQEATVVQGDVTRLVRTFDLGRDGMCLLSPKPIGPGTRCKVSFDVPFGDGPVNVTVAAKVVYSSYAAIGEFKIGVVFTDLDEGVALVLGKFAA
jgi:hypothetical protein